MTGFGEHVGVGGRTFRGNKHLGAVNVAEVISDLTGGRIGRQVEHGDGRVDAYRNGRDLTVTISAEEIHGSFREGRKFFYDLLRTQGYTHDEAMRRMTERL